MKTLNKYKSAIMIGVVMFVYILVINGLPYNHKENTTDLYKSIEKIMEEGPYLIEGEGMLVLPNKTMSTMNQTLTIHFGIDGHLDFLKKDHEIQMSLKDTFGYEEVPLGRYRGLGNTHLIYSEIGTSETIDISAFIAQASSKDEMTHQEWQNFEKGIEVNRSWVKNTKKGYNPIKTEVTTYSIDLSLLLSQAVMEALSHSIMTSLVFEEALVSYHTDRNGNPTALDFEIRTQEMSLEVSLNIIMP
ncbi:MAG: hypothetical protein K9L62_09410 [Vallitaleaceae bacterium]|nr:hypothetical protein [Vallitaleaceae bacterium]